MSLNWGARHTNGEERMGAAEIRSRLVSRRLGQAECNDEGDDEGDDAATAAAPPPPIVDRTKSPGSCMVVKNHVESWPGPGPRGQLRRVRKLRAARLARYQSKCQHPSPPALNGQRQFARLSLEWRVLRLALHRGHLLRAWQVVYGST